MRLVSSSRNLSVLTVDTTYTGRILSGLLSTNLGVSFGLKRFGANKDNQEWYRNEYTPKAQFRRYNINISWLSLFAPNLFSPKLTPTFVLNSPDNIFLLSISIIENTEQQEKLKTKHLV